LQLRLAASANLSRPSFDQLSPNLTLNEPGAATINEIHSSTGGNPALKPMTSRNFDASLEWYFARTGSISVAGFYKKIDNYIQTAVVTSNITFPDGQAYPYDITSYNNVANATVKGVEASYQQFFDFLPGALKGLGVQGNFTYVDSRAEPGYQRPGHGCAAPGAVQIQLQSGRHLRARQILQPRRLQLAQ
jgi:TonB-dependent receptor